MSIYRKGKVFIQDIFAGIIEETDEGYKFQYLLEYLNSNHPVPASQTLPLRGEPYVSPTLFPFFDGLIPEGWLLGVVKKNWGIEQSDRFAVLLVACRDCIGDVQVYNMEDES